MLLAHLVIFGTAAGRHRGVDGVLRATWSRGRRTVVVAVLLGVPAIVASRLGRDVLAAVVGGESPLFAAIHIWIEPYRIMTLPGWRVLVCDARLYRENGFS
ncbi:hypothetical protein [Nonomuraea sediminis]|uniref:hypothetical protein n=1 Tax=Nonomuraea sediminis TaxID=2835864 RepID=UPI001BDC2AC8|nr:hypothetical protein [Nonomuraea sediminis]